MKLKLLFTVFTFLFCVNNNCFSQKSDVFSDIPKNQIKSFIKSNTHRMTRLTNQMKKNNQRYIKKYVRLEKRIKKKMSKSNTDLTDKLFSQSSDPILYKSSKETHSINCLYSYKLETNFRSYQDTLKNALLFINKFKLIDDSTSSESIEQLNKLNIQEHKATEMRTYFRNRKSFFTSVSNNENITIPYYKKMDKLNYYYGAQINEYNDRFKKGISKSDQLILNAFQKDEHFIAFYNQTSIMSTFKIISNMTELSKKGYQTIAITNDYAADFKLVPNLDIKNTMDSTYQTYMNSASKYLKFDYQNVNLGDIPSFKPNKFRTKPFKDRINVEFDFHFEQMNNYFPQTLVLEPKIGFQLNDKLTFGVMANYASFLGSSLVNIKYRYSSYGIGGFGNIHFIKNIYLELGYIKNLDKHYSYKNDNYAQIKGKSEVKYVNQNYIVGFKLKQNLGKNHLTTITWFYQISNNVENWQNGDIMCSFGWLW